MRIMEFCQIRTCQGTESIKPIEYMGASPLSLSLPGYGHFVESFAVIVPTDGA